VSIDLEDRYNLMENASPTQRGNNLPPAAVFIIIGEIDYIISDVLRSRPSRAR